MLSLKRRFRRRLAARMRQFFGAARLSRRRVVRGSTPAIESLEVRWMLSSTTADIDETPLADQPRAFIGPDVSLVTQGSSASHPGTCCCAGCMALLPSAQMALGSMPSGGDLPPSGNAPFPLANTFLLNSRPSASRTIYLDFNGNTATGTSWNKTYGSSIVTPAYSFEGDSSFSDAELERIQYIWQRVVEDFAPFDVNITTQDPGSAGLTKSNSSDTTWGVRVCIGGSYSDWYGPACGGVSMIGTFASSSESPNFVFANNLYNDEKYVAEAISHEVGHSLGLSHDGQTPSTTYYAGHGSGATGWAPIMGSGYYQEVTQWSKGEYSGANNTQDDLAIITGANNFGYRVDDYGSSLGTASTLAVVNGTGVKLVNQAGVIERNTDTDWFKFSSSGGNVSLTFSPWVRGANLDISASLYNSSGQLVASSNPADALGASITVTVGAGDYYVMLDGVGVRGVSDGYSDYGSLGQYTITGTIEDNVAASNASVAGRIWHDRNGNSAIDSGEEGLAGVVVYIDANNNGVFDSATELSRTTAADGSYMFSALAAGDYRIREVYTSGWLAVGASSQLVTLAAGQSATSINFGNALPASVAGRTWHDRNANGIADSGEEGLGGVLVYIDANNNGVFDSGSETSITTATDGTYSINGLMPGSERIRTVPVAGWAIVGDSSKLLTLTSGLASSANDFALDNTNYYSVGDISDIDAAVNSVNENAANGTSVGIRANAVDQDTTNNVVTYSLSADAGGRFAIDPVTGIVTVARGDWLDREAAAAWSITVVATSQDGSSKVKAFTISLNDVNEFVVGAVSDTNADLNSVDENAPNGTTVGITAFAVDRDATNNGVTYSLSSNAGGRFAIDPSTGVVTVIRGDLLDREAAAAWSITVVATSLDGSTSTKAFTITLNDVDEYDVSGVTDVDSTANQVVEGTASGTAVGITALASDLDASNNVVTYSLADSAGGRFTINSATGVVTVADSSLINFGLSTSHVIVVTATSSDGSTASQSYTIDVAQALAPRLTLSSSSVAENLSSGTVVGTLGFENIQATSPTYALVTGTGGDDNGKFAINGSLLKTRSTFNFESKSSYTIRVQMKSSNGALVVQVFTISVIDVNEKPISVKLSNSQILEGNAIGDTVGDLLGVDPDAGDVLSYSLVSGSGSADNVRFTIVGNQLRAAEVFSYARKRSMSIRVRTTDAAGLFYEMALTIKVLQKR